MTLFVILTGCLSIFFIIIAVYTCDDIEDYMYISALWFIFQVALSVICILYESDNKMKTCTENTHPIKPTIIHVQDSSRKLLTYNSTQDSTSREIIIKNTDIEFFIPESLLYVQPCDGKISAKKEGE